jgi:cation:H+ antiporter
MPAYPLLLAGFVAMIVCGNLLVTGSVQLARYFKISTLVVGLTIVAYGTSTPEIFISVKAALSGSHDIALGNVIGSNIGNIGFILAIVALILPIPIRNKSLDFDMTMMFGITLLLLVFGFNGTIGRVEAACFLLILVTYTIWLVHKSRKKAGVEKTIKPSIKPIFAVLMILAAIVGLYFGSGWFVEGARELALMWGVSERVIGVSIVAVGTSMPELIVSLIAIFKKEADLSVGNIIGSNFFNIAGVLGITAIVSPITIGNHTLFLTDMAWLFGISVVLLLVMLPFTKGKITRRESVLLLLIFATYMFMLYR